MKNKSVGQLFCATAAFVVLMSVSQHEAFSAGSFQIAASTVHSATSPLTENDAMNTMWSVARKDSRTAETLTRGFEVIRDSAIDKWSANMQTALVAFIESRPEMRKRTGSGWVSGNIFCRARGCVLELAENDVPAGAPYASVSSIRESLNRQPWMIQLRPIYEGGITMPGALLYMRLFEKVEVEKTK